MNNCFCFWYSPREKYHIAIKSNKDFNAIVSNFAIGFCGDEAKNYVLETENDDGGGVIQNLIVSDINLIDDKAFEKYLAGKVVS